MLIVDDDPDIRDVVSAMLEAVGLAVGRRRERRGRPRPGGHEPFDLLLLDWNLPRMTGLELCRALRKDPGLAALPVLFLTANASSQDMVEAFASGGDDYVVKPFRAPELGARIFSLLPPDETSVLTGEVRPWPARSRRSPAGAPTRMGGPQKPVPRLT